MTTDTQTNVGALLRDQRESLKLSLEAVHKRTRISIPFLEALEGGQFEVFPAEVYHIGFMKQYAKFLGLDPEKIYEMYKAQKQGQDAAKTPSEHKEQKTQHLPPSLPHEESQTKSRAPVIMLLLLALLLALGVLWKMLKQDSQTQSEAPQTVAETPVVQAPAPAPEQAPLAGKHRLEAMARTSSWLRIVADGKMVFEGVLPQGARHHWEAKDKFMVRSGYVPGVELTYNGKSVDLRKVSRNNVAEITLRGENP